MSLDQCLAERAEAQDAGPPPRTRRPVQVRPVPQLESLREFGTLIRKQLVHCGQTGARPLVLLVEVDTLAGPPAQGDPFAAVGMRLRGRVRGTDLVVQIGARYGVFLLGDAGRHAPAIRERLRLGLQDDFMLDSGACAQIRPRFGMAIHPGAPVSGVELVEEAKRALEGAERGHLARV